MTKLTNAALRNEFGDQGGLMKKYIVTYTEDYGTTYECREVESASYTFAYVMVDMTLPSYAAITSIVPA